MAGQAAPCRARATGLDLEVALRWPLLLHGRKPIFPAGRKAIRILPLLPALTPV